MHRDYRKHKFVNEWTTTGLIVIGVVGVILILFICFTVYFRIKIL